MGKSIIVAGADFSQTKINPAVAAPTFSPAPGTYTGEQTVNLACTTAGADIYYTLDGTEPNTKSTLYQHAIVLSNSKTIKAIAVKNNSFSDVVEASYTIVNYILITVNVKDGNTPITDATVEMVSKDGNIAPSSSSGGNYVFRMQQGNFELRVTKTGYITHQEQITVTTEATINVALQQGTVVDLVQTEDLIVSPKPVWGFSSVYDATYATVDGHMLQTKYYRASVLIDRNNAENPVPWHSSSQASASQKELYSLFEIDRSLPYIKASVDSNYRVTVKLATTNPGDYYESSGAGWVQTDRVKCNYNGEGPVYLSVYVKQANDVDFAQTPTFEQLGLTIIASDILQ